MSSCDVPSGTDMLRRAVSIVEVSPRDGLQNEQVRFTTEQKVELIVRAAEAGLRRIEVASFVDPQRVPQMADGEAVVAALPRQSNLSYIGLVLNRRGADRALAAGVDEINVAFAATETFNQRNQRASVAESIQLVAEICAEARAARVRVTATIGAAFGCPFEGEVPLPTLVALAAELAASGVNEIALADTIGVAVPIDVTRRLSGVRAMVGDIPLRCHFHDTRNTAMANASAALLAGVGTLDASLGGLGGCPFAPAATGNLATEDLLYLLDRTGLPSAVSPGTTLASARWLERQLGRPLASSLSKAGWFPKREEEEAGE